MTSVESLINARPKVVLDPIQGSAIELSTDTLSFLAADPPADVPAEPETMFGWVAELCAATFGATCTVELLTSDRPFCRLERPTRVDGGGGPDRTAEPDAPSPAFRRLLDEQIDTLVAGPGLSVAISGGAAGQAYLGALSWARDDARSPTSGDIHLTRLMIERAAVLIDRALLVQALGAARTRADNLDRALASNRVIGVAIGILMASRRLTEAAAFEALRTVSQNCNRKLRDVAEDVVVSGSLDATSGTRATPSVPEVNTARRTR